MRLLVSSCNQAENRGSGNARHCLFTVDLDSGGVQPLVLDLPEGTQGITGLAAAGPGYLAITQNSLQRDLRGEPHLLLQFSADLELLQAREISGLLDPHSLYAGDDGVYIASTGKDSVLRIDLATGSRVAYPLSDAGEDTLHVNGLVMIDGALCYSAFGRRDGETHASAENGYIARLRGGEIVADGISHPHSPCCQGGALWVCESARGRLLRDGAPLLALDAGYLRGLCLVDDRVVVGVSRRRSLSRSLRRMVADSAPAKVGCCELRVYQWQYGDLLLERTIDLGEVADEVYDLLPLR